jgi:UDP-glucose 4-epimerase
MSEIDISFESRLRDALAGARVWVSGGRGFIGGRMVELLTAAGGEPILFDGDVRDADEVARSIADAAPSLLYNLAAPVDVSRDPSLRPLMDAVVLGGATAVADAVASLPDRALLVQVGTCEEYGRILAPFSEDDEPGRPVSPYAAAKLAATREVLRRCREQGLRAVVARPFLTYGPGQTTAALVPAAIDAALDGRPFEMTAGLQTRELNHVDDVALGLLRVAATPALEGRIVNVASGDERRVVDLARLIFELAGAPADLLRPGARPTRPGEVPRFFADVRRCRDVLGHRPAVSIEDGLRRTIAAARIARAEEPA